MTTTGEIKLTPARLKKLANDNNKSAAAANLIYVTDKEEGIERIKEGSSYTYTYKGKAVTDDDTLGRIKSLVIPPAWQNVWICAKPLGHLQATGTDAMGRKQYKYHSAWSALRNMTKFHHLLEFGHALPSIRKQIQHDLSKQGLPMEKVLATVISLMQCTCIRIGNSMYEKLYGSFGLTTLKDKHVKITGSELKFSFKGKKGVFHDISLKSRKLANIVQQCRDIPGKELFQYYDENGQRHAIDSGMVNDYIKQINNGHFTAKDFRTWAGTLHALEVFNEMEPQDTVTGTKKKIVEMYDAVAKHLGNTRSVCKKYYVHPLVVEHFTNHTLPKYYKRAEKTGDTCAELSFEEHVLLSILEDTHTTIIAA